MLYHYRVHALTVSAPFPCEELDPAPAGATSDVRIVEGAVPEALAGAILCDGTFDATPERFLLRGGPRSARMLIEHGTTITFERSPGCEQPLLLHHLLYQAMAAVLRQRDLLVFHASAALSPSGAVIVAGESGTGKSTTIARLARLGWPLHSDDVTALRVASAGLEVLPGASRVHLYHAAANAVDLPTAGLTQHDWHRHKMAVPAPVAQIRRPEPVRRIVLLERAPVAALQIERLVGRAKMRVLFAAYGPLFPAQIARLTPVLTRVLQDVDVLSISRPDSDWTLDAVIAAISEDSFFQDAPMKRTLA